VDAVLCPNSSSPSEEAAGRNSSSKKKTNSSSSCSTKAPLSASLHVDPANAAAVSLYRASGFSVDARLEDYYSPGRPALRMIFDKGE